MALTQIEQEIYKSSPKLLVIQNVTHQLRKHEKKNNNLDASRRRDNHVCFKTL